MTCTRVLGTLAAYMLKKTLGTSAVIIMMTFLSFYNQLTSFLVKLSFSCIAFIHSLFFFQLTAVLFDRHV